MTPTPRTDVCDVRIGWVLQGAQQAWAGDVRYVDTFLPPDAVAQLVRSMGRALAGETVFAEHFRATRAFGLQN